MLNRTMSRRAITAGALSAAVVTGVAGLAAPAEASPAGDQVVAYAEAQLGKPYVYGAEGPNSFDCSGLTLMAYKQVGVTIKRKSTAQHTGFRRVPRSERQPGDLIWWEGIAHVGIYAGGGQIIDASGSRHKVVKRDVYTYSGQPALYYRIVN